jgi:hypothetical protein
MQHPDSEAAVANLCRHSNDILFSSSPVDYKEVTHFNVQPPEYWAELFARQGFYRDVDFDASFLTDWAVRFRRKNEPVPRMVRDYERKFWLLWKENRDVRSMNIETRQELNTLRSEISSLRQRTVERDNQFLLLRNELASVYDSRTWRWGKKLSSLFGLRNLLRLFKKPRQR